jgi:hypothetical protein
MPDADSIPSHELIARWRLRQQAILELLPPDLLAEYRRLDDLIAAVQAEESQIGREQMFVGTIVARPRTPLSFHRKRLADFLRDHGPATRVKITSGTRIPMGSLSELLSGGEFEQRERGLWGLRKEVKDEK